MARVLVVEDNRDVANAVAVLLELYGHEVCVLDDGIDALNEVERRLPDAIVLDIGLPSLDGTQVARRLRQLFGHTVRLIAYTGFDDDVTRQKVIQAGFDVILPKPAAVDELLDAVDGAQLRRERAPADRRRHPRQRHGNARSDRPGAR